MIPDFFNLSYLAQGSEMQKKGLKVIQKTYVMEILSDFDPVLAGTLPLDLFTQKSDLDILCYTTDLIMINKLWIEKFQFQEHFTSYFTVINSEPSAIARFTHKDFHFELFAQEIPTRKQVAFRHMTIEAIILEKEGMEFKNEILRLKNSGIKTEPAFAQLLGLEGDPYEALLHYKAS